MQRNRQLMIVGGILAVGVLAALPFARRVELPVPGQPLRLRPLQEVPLHLPAESAQSPAVGLRDQDALGTSLAVAPSIAGSRLEDSGLPPELPSRYHSLENAAAAPVHAPSAPRSLLFEEPRLRMRPPEPDKSRERTHRVVDGDTLARIARRYWNDAALADALYAANRSVLTAPDPLPIGVELRIPSPPPPTTSSGAAGKRAAVEELPPPVRQPLNMAAEDDLAPIVRDGLAP